MKRARAFAACFLTCVLAGAFVPANALAEIAGADPGSRLMAAPETPAAAQTVLRAAVLSQAADASGSFHAAVTASKDSYVGGSTAIVQVKYDIDRGAVHGGDYVFVQIPQDIASQASFSVSPQHFSGVEDLGGGRYKLVFGPGAETALSGSFSMYVTTREVDDEIPGTVDVAGATKVVTVTPGAAGGGVGVYTDTIMKDASENEAVHYGDYDYSEGYGDAAAQVGVFDSSVDQNLKYRLYVNDKKASISNVTVVDTLPGGMAFDRSKPVQVIDRETGADIDASSYRVSIDGDTLTFAYPGEFSNTIQINYWVDVPAGGASKYTNRAEITYTQDGKPHGEHRDYVLQSSDFSAANGEKSVDKTEVSTASDDQWVTYTIKFWQQGGFEAGEIDLVDQLDPSVAFLFADDNPNFEVSYDEAAHAVRITNAKEVATTQYVRFTCDFSKVAGGGAVTNSVGGNTVTTVKDLPLELVGAKTVNGAAPPEGKAFAFELVDQDGAVVAEATSDARGNFSFAGIEYTLADVGKAFSYTVREKASSAEGYTVSPASYDVTVSVRPDGAGIAADIALAPDGAASDAGELAFDNVPDEPRPEPEPEPGPEPEPEPEPEPGPEPEPEPDIDAHKLVDKAQAAPGDKLTYTIEMTNSSDYPAQNIFVKDFVPESTTFVSVAGVGAEYGCTLEGEEFATWKIPELGAGQTVKLQMVVKVNECSDVTSTKNTAHFQTGKEPDNPTQIPEHPSNPVTTQIVPPTPAEPLVPKTTTPSTPRPTPSATPSSAKPSMPQTRDALPAAPLGLLAAGSLMLMAFALRMRAAEAQPRGRHARIR